jgi:hypothetical protein
MLDQKGIMNIIQSNAAMQGIVVARMLRQFLDKK